jgi:murein DD-endopeptidase MepM/ murein hydrolase activator NlpD
MSASVRVRAVVVAVALFACSLAGMLADRTRADAAAKHSARSPLAAPAPLPAPASRSAKAKAAALRRQVADLQRATAVAISNYDTVYEALGTVVTARLKAEQELTAANALLRDDGDRADGRMRALYEGGGGMALYASVLESNDLHDAAARWANISALVADDERNVEAAEAAVRRAAAAEATLHAAATRQTKLEGQAAERASEVEKLLDSTQALLAAADAEVQRLVEAERLAEERRRLAEYQAQLTREAAARAAATGILPAGSFTPTISGRYACPVGLIRSFVDTWGAARSGGRHHQGTDVFAPKGSPAFAVTDGVISRWSTNTLGGTTLYLRSDAGDEFYYAHNDRNIATAGTRVKAGDVIALVGNTGNAATTPSHIHFEVHPGGGTPVNPYAFLKGICG